MSIILIEKLQNFAKIHVTKFDIILHGIYNMNMSAYQKTVGRLLSNLGVQAQSI